MPYKLFLIDEDQAPIELTVHTENEELVTVLLHDLMKQGWAISEYPQFIVPIEHLH